MLKVTYHGHSCFEAEGESGRILIDPFITGNPLASVKPEQLNPTAILVTHGHGDHLGDAIPLSRRTGAPIIAPFELASYCQAKGAGAHPMHIGGSHTFEFGTVKLTPALHGSAVMEDDDIVYTGNPCGFLITMDGKTLYHAGDTGLFTDMKWIGDRHPIDLAMLPIGDNFTMGPEDAALAAEWLHPKKAVPMHFDTFDVIKSDTGVFFRKLQALQIEAVRMKPGDSLTL